MADRPGEMDERDVDERFASIIARWDGPVPGADPDPAPSPADPATDDRSAATVEDDAPAGDSTPEADASPSATRPAWVNPSPLDSVVVPASTWRAAETPSTDGPGGTAGASSAKGDAEPEEEHYEPPPVTLPPQEDLHFWGAVIGLVAGPLMLLYVVFARPFHSTRWFVASVLVSLLGFGLLVLRQPRNRDELDGDDGARV